MTMVRAGGASIHIACEHNRAEAHTTLLLRIINGRSLQAIVLHRASLALHVCVRLPIGVHSQLLPRPTLLPYHLLVSCCKRAYTQATNRDEQKEEGRVCLKSLVSNNVPLAVSLV